MILEGEDSMLQALDHKAVLDLDIFGTGVHRSTSFWK
jgi:hypothetical protein